MIFLYIYIGFSLLTFVLMWLQTITLSRKIVEKHGLTKTRKADHVAMFLEMLKIFIMSFVPILNLILFCSVVFLGNRIEKEVTKQVEEKIEEAKLLDIIKTN